MNENLKAVLVVGGIIIGIIGLIFIKMVILQG